MGLGDLLEDIRNFEQFMAIEVEDLLNIETIIYTNVYTYSYNPDLRPSMLKP